MRTMSFGVVLLMSFAGAAAQAQPAPSYHVTKTVALGAPIMAAAGLKILYDGLLYFSFRKLKAPEER